MFDRDNPKYIFNEPFIKGKNNVYKFNLQIPSHRNPDDLISVEHCLTDENLKTPDENGRRIFLSGEFGNTGLTVDNQFICHHRFGTNPLEIIDGSNNKKVFKTDSRDTNNYALSKNDFIQKIINNEPGFDNFSFDGFISTLNIIKTIINDVESN